MTFTGILLVRADRSESLDEPLNPWLAQKVYGQEPVVIESYHAGDFWVSLSEGSLYVDGTSIGSLEGKLLQVVRHPVGYLVLSETALVLLSEKGEWGDRMLAGEDIPLKAPLEGLKVKDMSVLLWTPKGVVMSEDLLNWKPASLDEEEKENLKPLGKLREDIKSKIEEHRLGQAITWERFMLDLHSGRLLGGSFGMLLVEVSAWGLILLTFTGLYIWFIKLRVREG